MSSQRLESTQNTAGLNKCSVTVTGGGLGLRQSARRPVPRHSQEIGLFCGVAGEEFQGHRVGGFEKIVARFVRVKSNSTLLERQRVGRLWS